MLNKSGKIPVAKDKFMILESFSEKNCYRLFIHRLEHYLVLVIYSYLGRKFSSGIVGINK